MAKTQSTELIDRLRLEWNAEDPALDTSAMDIVGRIINLGNRWSGEANTAVKPFGLKYTEFDIIATLRRSGPPYELTPTQLCDSVLLTSGAMTTALNRVERLGLIEREESQIDKRVKIARLTKKGKDLARRAAKKRFELAAEQISDISQSDVRELTALLKKL